jgi:hypothetical protein
MAAQTLPGTGARLFIADRVCGFLSAIKKPCFLLTEA